MDEQAPNFTDYDSTRTDFSWDAWLPKFSFHQSGKVNYGYEVSDYQVALGRGGHDAIVEQKPDGTVVRATYAQLAEQSNSIAASLRARGLKPGSRFGIYAPKSVEYAVVLIAAVKCGAIAVPLFDAFGKDAIIDRLGDCGAQWLYTAKALRGAVIDASLPALATVLTEDDLPSLHEGPAEQCVVWGDLETPFMLHYTSGSTGKPKGIVLAQRAMIGHLVTALYVLDLKPEDKYWNTGDPGWVTGMVYNFFAPLLVGTTVHLYGGRFNAQEWVGFMSRMGITVWYSSPTAFRLLRYHNAPLDRDHLPLLRHIVSAGEPLNPELIEWTMRTLGIPIHDSWYMTEQGHQLINNYRCLPVRPGSMGKPLPGVVAAILDESCRELPPRQAGRLAIKVPWPGLMKEVWNNREKFDSYFEQGWYISGDTAYRDEDGYYWFKGREDDMIKSAGKRLSPFEIESALVSHPWVAEAGVIAKPSELFGSIVKAFILLKPGVTPSTLFKEELISLVKDHSAAHLLADEIEFVSSLPKTKSGKIMRRVLRARETGAQDGDLSTLDEEMNPDK